MGESDFDRLSKKTPQLNTTLTAFKMFQLLLLPLALASPTTNPDNDCGHPLDCVEHGDGWHPDPYNCRKFWHCYGGVGQHYACRTDMLFDLRYNGCNYDDQTDCGDRWFKNLIRVKH